MSFFSFLDISLDTANKFYSWGWKASLFGAAITLIGVSLLMWGTRIRDKDFELQIGQLNVEASKANERTAILEKSKIELQTILEKERIARLNLEAQVSPRRLTTEMQEKLAIVLSPFRGSKILIKSYALDVESAVLGTQIIKILEVANIVVVNNILSQSSLGSVGLGVRVTGKNKTLVENLLNSFSSIGNLTVLQEPIPQGTGIYTGINNEADMDAIIFVGAKPIHQ